MIFGTFLRSGSKGVPGWSQGHSKGPSRVKIAPKWVSKWLKHINKCCPKAFWKRFSKTCDLSMFPNSSWLFLVFSYSCRGRFCATFVQVKSRHSSTWLGGKTYGGCLPDASQMPLSSLISAPWFQWFLLNDLFSMIVPPMIPPPWFFVIDFSWMIFQVGLQRNSVWGLALGSCWAQPPWSCSLSSLALTGRVIAGCHSSLTSQLN